MTMIEIARILCPVDFSEFSRHAVDHALAIAHWYGARVTALHVIPPVATAIPAGDAGIYPPLVLTPDELRRLQTELAAFVGGGAGEPPVEALVVAGRITSEIVRLAREMPADLLVMGTHGRSGFERLLLGSATEKMLRKAPCPLLTVPRRAPDAVPAGGALFTRILCAVDFSPSSLQALALAESLAKEADAELTVLHVLEPVSFVEPVTMGGSGAPPIDPDAPTAARRRLSGVVSSEARTFSHLSEVVTSGKPYREILREAADRRSELIVLGAHGGGLGVAAFGSTTNHVVRDATCPVLSVRA
jgi:nucleotide-binding universal stress UspA family protein